ncbi:MAG: YihY/virulence factor BrkB family protein [Syntrophorhabdaceae bacterium]|nr:YihY/virulence factor BrkB family protein [Syntrophorhabdaceae bacterium]
MRSSGRVPAAERIGRSLRVVGIIIRESLKSFLVNNDFEMSAALATYSFFALVPLLFFAVSIAPGLGSASAALVAGIEGLIDHLFPRIRDWMSIDFYVATRHHLTLGFAAAIVVFIAAMSLVDSLRTAFLKIFKMDSQASFVISQFANVRTAAAMILLFIVLIGAEVVFAALAGMPGGGRGAANVLLSVCIATMCMVFFYTVFLPVRLTAVKLIGASVISAVLIISMREAFTFVIRTNPAYGETFGSLKVLFVMIVWVYYCFLVILFGAEVAINAEKRDALLLKTLFAGHPGRSIPAGLLTRFITRYSQGDVIFNEGDNGGTMFYIVAGSVDIDCDGKHIRTMAPGHYFGEMSMLLGTPRSAGARAASENTELIAISQANFDIILRENAPIVLSVLKEMAGRLKDTDESLFRRQ